MEKKKSTPKSSLKKTKSPAKSVKKSVSKEATQGTREPYKYQKLDELFKQEIERINLYAVVLDSSAPYYLDSLEKYLCTVKLIDDTINPRDSVGGKPAFVSTTVFAKMKGEIPQATKMGTIIRIHRGETKKFEKSFQLNCDVNIKASWVLFDPTESFIPVAHTGRTYTFAEDDKKRVRDIRKFADKFLKDYDVTDASSIGAKKGEIDLFCQILKRKNKDKTFDRLAVFDGEEFYKFDIPKDRYTHIAPRDLVRVRGISKKAGNFLVNDYTNIVKLDNDYNAAEALKKKIEEAKKTKEISDKLAMYFPLTEEPLVLSEVLDKKPKLTSLKELFSADAAKLKDKRFKVNVSVLEIGPKDPKSWVVPVDPKARKQHNLPESATHYYKLQLFSKDASAPEDHNIYTLYLCTIDGKGKEFIPTTGKVKKSEKELKKIYKTLTKPWVTLDLIVEGVPVSGGSPIYFIVDTELNF